MKTIDIAGLIAGVVLLAPHAAHAQSDPIGTWVKAVNKKLDASMVYPLGGQHGTAQATIRRTEDGRAVLVDVSADSPAIARAARRTVARLRNVPPLPVGFKGQPIRMQMLIGNPNDAYAYYRSRKQMLAKAETNNVQLASRLAKAQLAFNEAR